MALTIPTSWNDLGMNWNNPDPSDIKYALALREAIYERISVLNVFPTPNVDGTDDYYHFLPDKNKISMQKFAKWVYLMIDYLAQRYADMDYKGYLELDTPYRFYQSSFSNVGFPRTYNSASELQKKIKEIFVCIPYNETSDKYVDFFKGAKKALDMMRYSKITRMRGNEEDDVKAWTQEASVKTAVDESIRMFLEAAPKRKKKSFTTYSQNLFTGLCGTFVTNYNKGTYWAQIYNFKVEIEEIFPFSDDRKPDILCYAIALKNDIDAPSVIGAEIQYNDFWCEPFGLKEGYNLINLRKMEKK